MFVITTYIDTIPYRNEFDIQYQCDSFEDLLTILNDMDITTLVNNKQYANDTIKVHIIYVDESGENHRIANYTIA